MSFRSCDTCGGLVVDAALHAAWHESLTVAREPVAANGPPHWFSTRGVAELIGFTALSVSRAAARGDLPGVKVGGTWRFTYDQVRVWVEGSTKRRNRARQHGAGARGGRR